LNNQVTDHTADWDVIVRLAQTHPPLTYEDANRSIEAIGSARRELEQLKAAMNEKLAAIKADYEKLAAGPGAANTILTAMVREYCKAHRAELTSNGARKSHKFPAGEVAWRKRPPRISILKKAIPAALAWLHANKLAAFIRSREELDKEALLKAPDKAALIPGVKVQTGGETFEISPFAAELTSGANGAASHQAKPS
jgi:phage host-nuclease inhibitor protein Gam